MRDLRTKNRSILLFLQHHQDGFWDEVETDFFSPAFGQRQQPYRNRNRGEYGGGDYERAAEEYGYRQQRPGREAPSSGNSS